jgi:NAD(P)-dependent dehydrogenase (short-subunit alcohol dehydrogenase family)
MAGRLAGKVAIITGSTSGIGRATANLFAQEGARVAVSGRRENLGAMVVEEIRAAGGEAAFFQVDVAKSEQVEALVHFAADTYGRLDVLMNNAFSGKHGSVVEMDEADWDSHLAVALKAVYLGCKFAIPVMLRTGGGSIINTASAHGFGGGSRHAAYEAAKAGVINLSRQIAVDFGPQGIRVNSLCPGWTITERNEVDFAERERKEPGWTRRATLHLPLRRFGQPVELARAALFLASDESSFVTGHALCVDGGEVCQLQGPLAGSLRAELAREWGVTPPGT